MISIAMCTYNGSMYVKEQLCSIMAQTIQPDELVICDDCSTDNTVDIITECLSNWNVQWRLCKNECNLGYVKNFEKAIDQCKGDIIFLSDQDDVWHKDKIRDVINVFESDKNIYIVVHDVLVVDKNLNAFSKQPNGRLEHKFFSEDTMADISLQGSAMAFKSSLVDFLKPFPPFVAHDRWIAINSLLHGGYAHIDSELSLYRQSDINTIGVTNESTVQFFKRWLINFRESLVKHYSIIELQSRMVSELYSRNENIINTRKRVLSTCKFSWNRIYWVSNSCCLKILIAMPQYFLHSPWKTIGIKKLIKDFVLSFAVSLRFLK